MGSFGAQDFRKSWPTIRNLALITAAGSLLSGCAEPANCDFYIVVCVDAGEEAPTSSAVNGSVDQIGTTGADSIANEATGSETPQDSSAETSGTGPEATDPIVINATSITRYEAQTADGSGGYLADVSYDSATDSFSVIGLAFDGTGVYTRSSVLPTLSTQNSRSVYAVYESPVLYSNPDTGQNIDQQQYVAIYAVSDNLTVDQDGNTVPTTRFSIVRSGSFSDLGFGGFVYERNGEVAIPVTGQVEYAGEYAGIRVFDQDTRLSYVNGSMNLAIDFDGFSGDSAISGSIFDRTYFNEDGVQLNTLDDVVTFDVGSGILYDNGEFSGSLESASEAGTYYAVIGGDAADEVVGVIVLETLDPDQPLEQETGGFILYAE